MNTKFINWHTLKLVIIWFLAVFTSDQILGTSVDMKFMTIMIGGIFSAIAFLLIALGLWLEIKQQTFWWSANTIWLLSMNVYMWLVPFVPDLMPMWAWYWAVVINLVSVQTIYSLSKFVNRLNPEIR